jgi:hypothetical protein
MIGIRKNHKALVTIAALASLLLVNIMTIGTAGHIALARHAGINVQTDTNQGQACETASGTSLISDSCTASSTDMISQEGGVSPTQAPPSRCTPTMHPTVLTLAISPNPDLRIGEPVLPTGTLSDICTGSGISGATITFTGTGVPGGVSVVTDAAGSYPPFSVVFAAPGIPGNYTVQAHFSGLGIFGLSNSAKETLTVH